MKNFVNRTCIAGLHPIFHFVFLLLLTCVCVFFISLIGSESIKLKIAFAVLATFYSLLFYSFIILLIEVTLFKLRSRIRGILAVFIFFLVFTLLYLDISIYNRFESHLIRFLLSYLINLDRISELYVYLTTMSNDFSAITISTFLYLGCSFFLVLILNKCALLMSKYKHLLKLKDVFLVSIASVVIVTIIQFSLEKQWKQFHVINKKIFPWYINLARRNLQDDIYILQCGLSFRPLIDAKKWKQEADNFVLPKSAQNNIFLIVIETLRADAINQTATPELYKFGQENFHFPKATTASDNTAASLFSIFHGIHSIYINDYKKKHQYLGSLPIYLLHKMNYKIDLFKTVPELGFEKEMFGTQYPNQGLNIKYVPSSKDELNYDELVSQKIASFIKTNIKKGEPHFLTYYISAPHFTYSWPDQFPAVFNPFMSSSDVVKLWYGFRPAQEKRVLLKNRYLNSVRYADSLFGRFITNLKQAGLYDNSIIIVTGDHGEDLLDVGAGFGHGFTLNDRDVRIALLMKLGNMSQRSDKPVSNIDIFPTVLDFLGVRGNYDSIFDGSSILKNRQFFQSSFSPWANRVRFQTPEFSTTGIINYESAESSKTLSIFDVQLNNQILNSQHPKELQRLIFEYLKPYSPHYVELLPHSLQAP